jgi:hypothetical protein
LPEIDLTQTENARKWRADRLPCYSSTNLLDLSFRLLLFRRCLLLLGHSTVIFCASDRAFIDQTIETIEIEAGKLARRLSNGQLSLVLSQLSLFLPSIELHEQVALLN